MKKLFYFISCVALPLILCGASVNYMDSPTWTGISSGNAANETNATALASLGPNSLPGSNVVAQIAALAAPSLPTGLVTNNSNAAIVGPQYTATNTTGFVGAAGSLTNAIGATQGSGRVAGTNAPMLYSPKLGDAILKNSDGTKIIDFSTTTGIFYAPGGFAAFSADGISSYLTVPNGNATFTLKDSGATLAGTSLIANLSTSTNLSATNVIGWPTGGVLPIGAVATNLASMSGVAPANAAFLTSTNGTDRTWTTNLNASQLIGTLPVISGANLTALNASSLSSGTVPSAQLPINVLTNLQTASASLVQVGFTNGTLTVTNNLEIIPPGQNNSYISFRIPFRNYFIDGGLQPGGDTGIGFSQSSGSANVGVNSTRYLVAGNTSGSGYGWTATTLSSSVIGAIGMHSGDGAEVNNGTAGTLTNMFIRNLNASGVISGNGSGITNCTSITWTNFISGKVYTNTTTHAVTVRATAVLTGGTTGISTMECDVVTQAGGGTAWEHSNSVSLTSQTLFTQSGSGSIDLTINSGDSYCFTNSSVGTGNTVTLRSGTGQIVLLP